MQREQRSGPALEPAADAPARVVVVGTGGWGTTMAIMLAAREPVALLARRTEKAERLQTERENRENLPGVAFPPALRVTADPSVLESADLVIFAVPSAHLRTTVAALAPHIPARADLLSLVKGLERGTLLRMSEVITQAAGVSERRVAALSGPNLAAEIAGGLPASAVVGARDPELARRIQARLGSRAFRVYVNADIVGVELCGALKNIIAIAAGAADGLGFGDNGKAGLMTRGLAEMIRLGMAAGANPLTFAGLAGIGDVIATCGSGLSRNHRLGVELAKGRRWADIEADLHGVAEGAYTVVAANELASRLGVEMPIASEVQQALFEGKSVQRCLIDLLARESKDELADLPVWLDRLGPANAGDERTTGSAPASARPQGTGR